jgi:hypothetical protein
MRSEWQTHKGQQFFYCNYSDLGIGPLQAEMDEVDVFIAQQPVGSVLILTDVRGVSPSRQVVAAFIKSVPHTQKYLRKSAVIGIGFSGQRKVLFDAVMRITKGDVMVFEDIEAAKDWLVS